MSHHPAAKRFLTAITLGTIFGFVCLYLASRGHHEIESLSHPIFWIILTDRILIGMVVAFAGAFTVHPLLGFKYRPCLRGACLGAVVSLPIAPGIFVNPPTGGPMSPWLIFWGTLAAGAIYGAIIDIVATRVGGEGDKLLAVQEK
ncbi:MAG: hypothetical protein HQL73_03655 [Magnetococcales bacterium]|nr:hypothetical protein [Magnetococcales bacterium]